MTRTQAFISFFAFWTMAAIISLNALYMQDNISASLRGSVSPSSKVFRTNFKLVYAIQRELLQRHYGIEKISGRITLQTRGAIMAYQSDHKLPLTADASESLLQHILFGGYGSLADSELMTPNKKALKISVSVQQSLLEMGYSAGVLGSVRHPAFGQSIKKFEKDWKIPVTGRVSGRLIKTLQRIAGLNIKIQ